MVRTQIQLTEEQAMGLRRIAAERGISMAAVIRESVDRTLEQEDRAQLWEQAFAVFGKYTDVDGATDVSEEHDRYLDDAYSQWRRS
jgi:hypothetical protein